MKISQVLLKRELGLPQTQKAILKAIDQRIADNLAKDHFKKRIIPLPKNSYCNTFRSKNHIVVLSVNEDNIQRLALWSLTKSIKLLDLVIDSNYESENPGKCYFEDNGLLVVENEQNYTIISEGKISGTLPKYAFEAIQIIDNRIATYWLTQNQHDIDNYDSAEYNYGEWDENGILRAHYSLNNFSNASIRIHNNTYSIRLLESASSIEIIDRVNKTVSIHQVDQIQGFFTSAYVAGHILFYGKYLGNKSYLGVLNLETKITEKIPCDPYSGLPQNIIANDCFAAWLFKHGSTATICYLNFFKSKIKTLMTIHNYHCKPEICLNLQGSILTILYKAYNEFFSAKFVYDLTDYSLKSHVKYKGEIWDGCFTNGILTLINDEEPPYIYLESFIEDEVSDQSTQERRKIF